MRTHRLARLLAPLAIVLGVSQARAEEPEACSVAYARGQEERLAGRLFNARAAFLQCAVVACSTALASDCEHWVKEVEADLPTLRVTVRDEAGRAVEKSSVRIDGIGIPLVALSAPIVLEAGPHDLVIEAPGYQKVQLEKALRPSDREVPVVVTLRPPRAPVAAAPSRTVPTASWVLAGVSAVALGGSIYFGVKANDEYQGLKQSCAPRCAPSASDGMYSKAVISDVALAGAVLALAASATVYLIQPAAAPAASAFRTGGAERARVLLSF